MQYHLTGSKLETKFVCYGEEYKIIKKIKWAVLALGLFSLYVCIGMLVPFIYQKPVTEEHKNITQMENLLFDKGITGRERAAVIEDNKEALDLRLAMIKDAKKEIVLSTFDIRDGKSTEDVFSALMNAADRGVRVRVIVDGMYGMLHMKRNPVYYAAGSHNNIEIRFYNNPDLLRPWTIQGRMHDKYLLVDDSMLLMGGRNTFDYFLGDYLKEDFSFDREVFIYRTQGCGHNDSCQVSGICQVWDYFNAMWENPVLNTVYHDVQRVRKQAVKEASDRLYKHYGELSVNSINYTASTVPIKQTVLISNPTHIYSKEPVVFAQLSEIMKRAEKRVLIHTPYAVFSKDMYSVMGDIEQEAEGKTEMIVNSIASGDNICASADYRRNRSKILDTGISVYEYMGDYSTHGKSIAIDEHISIIGSYNLDNRSTYVNTEMMLVINGEELNRELTENMENLKALSLQVNADTGDYIPRQGVSESSMNTGKKLLIEVLSFAIQGFRYLV